MRKLLLIVGFLALVHPGQEQGGVLHAPGNKKAPDDAGAFEVTTLKSEDQYLAVPQLKR